MIFSELADFFSLKNDLKITHIIHNHTQSNAQAIKLGSKLDGTYPWLSLMRAISRLICGRQTRFRGYIRLSHGAKKIYTRPSTRALKIEMFIVVLGLRAH